MAAEADPDRAEIPLTDPDAWIREAEAVVNDVKDTVTHIAVSKELKVNRISPTYWPMESYLLLFF